MPFIEKFKVKMVNRAKPRHCYDFVTFLKTSLYHPELEALTNFLFLYYINNTNKNRLTSNDLVSSSVHLV